MVELLLMMRYVPSLAADLALADWWTVLVRDGDLPHMLARDRHPLGAFLAYFRDAVLLVEVDDAGLWAACWAKPWLGCAFVGLWVRRDRRGRRMLRPLLTALHGFLSHWPALIVLAWAPGRRDLYTKAGVRFAPEPIPGLIDGQPAWFGWLTAERLTEAFPMVQPAATDGAAVVAA